MEEERISNIDEEDYELLLAKQLNEAINEWIERGRNINLKDVPYDILYIIFRQFPPQKDWKALACALGVTNIQILTEIEGDANAQKKWESEILFEYCIKHSQLSFGDLISVLFRQLKRIAVLQDLYDRKLVEAFLNDYKGYAWSKRFVDSSSQYSPKLKAIVSSHRPTNEDRLLEEEISRLRNSRFIKGMQDVNCLRVEQQSLNFDQFIEKLKSKAFKQNPIIPPVIPSIKKLVILLSYSKDVNEIVPELVQRFWDMGVGVISEFSLKDKGYFETDFISSWQKFCQQSRFIVPILSKQYLMDIKEPEEEQQSRGVRFVYDLYTRRYFNKGCLNRHVRALQFDNVTSKMLEGVNPTLEVRWKLWEDVDEFLKMIMQHQHF